MCTVTLEYNPNNALARRKLAALLATGLFVQKNAKTGHEPLKETESRQLKEAFFNQSRKSMSHIVARYL